MSAVDALHVPPLKSGSRRESAREASEFAWRVLILLNLFRLSLAVLLLAVFELVADPRIIGEQDAGLAWAALIVMLSIGIVEAFLLRRRAAGLAAQTYLQFVLDLTVITVLMHASGGVPSGIGGLLVVSVGGLALLVSSERAFLLAALVTLAILAEQTLAHWQGMTTSAEYAPAGILGAVIFVITSAVQFLRRQIVATEALAEQRGVDLKNLAELNEYIIQHLRESIVVVDGENHIRLINESAANHLGAESRRVDRPLAELSAKLDEQLRHWREHGPSAAPAAPRLSSADGSTFIKPHFALLGRGRRGGVLIFLEDTSLLAERVQQSKLAALGRLSASIAHEIRNPVGAMSHAGQLLAESPDIGQQEHRLTDIIRVNARRVSQIVESVLALSRREKTQPERLQLKPWLEDFTREFVRTLELFEGSVRVVPESPDLEVYMDPTHLHQIVWNLCDNAVKYASQAAGAIAVELGCGRLDTTGRPYLEVADRGPGIDPERAEEVFEPFYTGRHGGTGLGLFISRELCESNGATLRYQPRPGGGSVFRIVFSDPQRWQSRGPVQ